jgi:serine/threonine protein kinase
MAVRQQTIADRYELKHIVGSGGMSTVYCAFDTMLERNVALKILHDQFGGDAEYVERFRREARSVAQLSHPNIVTVIDRGEEEGKQFIVFELIEGDNVKELVERGGPLPVRRALELGLEVARALAFAHGQGLVHRDVKPQNILLNDEGRAKVTDFGIARSLDTLSNTQTGTVLGTSHYIAPEQARGEHVDAQTDIYSFGVVLYELLTGELPYSGDNFLTVAMKHVNEPIPSVFDRRPDTPLRLASLIERCMAKSPADRPASMDDVVGELEACRSELDGKDGGDGEHDSEAPLATDGQAGTYWQTSRYRSSLSDIGKSGVGVVVDAGSARSLSQIAVSTDTPGFTAEIKAGDAAAGPFETVAAGKAVGPTTTWDLDGSEARYYVVWITNLGDQAQVHINEVKAT